MNQVQKINYSTLPWLNIFNQTIDQPKTLPGVLARYGVDSTGLSSIAHLPHETGEAYGRKILFNNEQIEVMLACWGHRAMAAPHNHGASRGMIWFAKGNFFEQHYRFQESDLKKNAEPLTFKENHVVTVDSNDIHSCQPETVGLSLHIYSPPIHKMKVWDLDGRRTLTVADHCGAWVPKNKSLIVSESAW
jgi:predicted metal-dependent enzyme (double-stranded beta helix superfamily)